MEKNEQKGDLFTKIVNSRKQSIVVATNTYDEGQLYITVPNLMAAYKASWMLNEFKFKSEHQKALKISEVELIKMKEQILKALNVSEIGEPQTLVECMISTNLQPADVLIEQIGLDGEVLAADQLLAPKTVMYFWPPYQTTKQFYTLILGGKKMFEDIKAKTEEEFEGIVPGRFDFNLGNWTKRQNGYLTSSLSGIQPSGVAKEAEEEKAIAAVVQPPEKTEEPLMDESYYNDSPPTVTVE